MLAYRSEPAASVSTSTASRLIELGMTPSSPPAAACAMACSAVGRFASSCQPAESGRLPWLQSTRCASAFTSASIASRASWPAGALTVNSPACWPGGFRHRESARGRPPTLRPPAATIERTTGRRGTVQEMIRRASRDRESCDLGPSAAQPRCASVVRLRESPSCRNSLKAAAGAHPICLAEFCGTLDPPCGVVVPKAFP